MSIAVVLKEGVGILLGESQLHFREGRFTKGWASQNLALGTTILEWGIQAASLGVCLIKRNGTYFQIDMEEVWHYSNITSCLVLLPAMTLLLGIPGQIVILRRGLSG